MRKLRWSVGSNWYLATFPTFKIYFFVLSYLIMWVCKFQEFLALTSSSLLRLGQEADREATKNRESVYLLLDQIVQESPFLTMDLLESCFPYALIRNAYHDVYKQEHALL